MHQDLTPEPLQCMEEVISGDVQRLLAQPCAEPSAGTRDTHYLALYQFAEGCIHGSRTVKCSTWQEHGSLQQPPKKQPKSALAWQGACRASRCYRGSWTTEPGGAASAGYSQRSAWQGQEKPRPTSQLPKLYLGGDQQFQSQLPWQDRQHPVTPVQVNPWSVLIEL